MPRCLAAASIAAIGLIAAASEGRAASFDCNRAMRGVETAICEDRNLSALDEQMAQNYRALLNRTSGATEARIRADQKNWLRQRNACGDDQRCLNSQYRARIQTITTSGEAGPAPRETAAVQAEEKPRGLLGGALNRNARAPEPESTEQPEQKHGLLARMIDRITPNFGRKEEEPAIAEPPRTEPTRRQVAQQQNEPAAPPQPMKIVGQRPTAKARVVAEEPVVAATEPARRKSVLNLTTKQQQPAAVPEPARQKSVPRQEFEPQVAVEEPVRQPEPVRQQFVLRPAIEQAAPQEPARTQEPPRTQLAARDEPNKKRKWEDLPTGTSIGGTQPAARVTRTETDRDADATRVKTTRVKPEPIEETADRPLTSAMTYAPENEDEAPAQRILRQEPRVQMIKPLIVRDRAAAEAAAPALDEQAPAPVAIEEEAPAPLVETETAALPPDPEPVVENLDAPIPENNIPELAALPNETPALPLDQEASSVPAPVREALKSRFDTAYGSPNRIDLLAPVRQTRHFDPSRFDIFNDPSGG